MSKILFMVMPKFDLTAGMLIQGLKKINNVELRFACLGNYADSNEVLSKLDYIKYGNEKADFVVLGSRMNQHPWVDSDIFWSVAGSAKRIFLDGIDDGMIDLDYRLYGHFDYIFKRDIYLKNNSLRNLVKLLRNFKNDVWDVTKAHSLIPFPAIHSLSNSVDKRQIKRNIASYKHRKKIFPFPLCVFDHMKFEFNEKPKFEISCILRPHSDHRKRFIEYLKTKKLKKSFIGEIKVNNKISKPHHYKATHPDLIPHDVGTGYWLNEPFVKQIQNSRSCISIPGAGFYSLSFWEILGAGSLLITKRIAVEINPILIENEHYLAFDTKEELDHIIHEVYSKPNEADRIRWQGYQFARKHHTSRERGEYFLNILTNSNIQQGTKEFK